LAKSDYLRVLIRHDEKLYSFVNVNCSPRDGSLNIALRRDGTNDFRVSWSNLKDDEEPKRTDFETPREKNQKITIHQSGRIHLPDLRHNPIFIEPLVYISTPFTFYAYRIPRISALSEFSKLPSESDLIIDLSGFPDDPQSFEFGIGPVDYLPNGNAVRIEYLRRYAFSIVHHASTLPAPPAYEEYFTTTAVGLGLFKEQVISEDVALIGFHQALNDTRDPIIYSPNANGEWQIIFSVQSRIAPRVIIEPTSTDLYVEVEDQSIEPRVNRARIKFKVKDKQSGRVIRELVTFRRIELSAEL
jgi:hypothetical protein